jgi:hypothetical protein
MTTDLIINAVAAAEWFAWTAVVVGLPVAVAALISGVAGMIRTVGGAADAQQTSAPAASYEDESPTRVINALS